MLALPHRPLFLGAVALSGLSAVAFVVFTQARLSAAEPRERVSSFRIEEIPFDGRQAYEYLKQICALGPRPSGSAGMVAQQKLVAAHFQRLGAQVSFQEFRGTNPLDGSPVPMANLIVQWHPDRTERILLCTHYDTRPYPDHDPRNPGGVLIGADDGASGLAVLMELGKWVPKLESKYGVDFVLFDGSQFAFKEGTWRKPGDRQFLGAEFFSQSYVSDPPPYKYRWGVLLNMVGNERLQVYEEYNSMSWRSTRPLVEDIWRVAYKTGVREFIATRKDSASDDHLRLNEIAKIPTCAIIDLDYPYWRTEQDTPLHCSPLALAKVGWVLLDWLPQAK
jgi:glutaminyl-peptide cyclotransferase